MTGQRAVHDQVGERDRWRGRKHDRVDRRHEVVGFVGVPAVRGGALLLTDVEARRHAVLGKRCPQTIVLRVRQRSSVDRGRARSSPCARRPRRVAGELRFEPCRITQRQVRCPGAAARPPRPVPLHTHRFQAPMLAVRAGNDSDSARSPQQPEVRENQHCLVEPPWRRAARPVPVGSLEVGRQRPRRTSTRAADPSCGWWCGDGRSAPVSRGCCTSHSSMRRSPHTSHGIPTSELVVDDPESVSSWWAGSMCSRPTSSVFLVQVS